MFGRKVSFPTRQKLMIRGCRTVRPPSQSVIISLQIASLQDDTMYTVYLHLYVADPATSPVSNRVLALCFPLRTARLLFWNVTILSLSFFFTTAQRPSEVTRSIYKKTKLQIHIMNLHFCSTSPVCCHALLIGSNLGVSILLKDASTCSCMQLGGPGIQTSNLLISRHPTLPPELQPPHSWSL